MICIFEKVSNFGFSPCRPATTFIVPAHYGYKYDVKPYLSMSKKQMHVTEITTASGQVNWLLVDVVARKPIVKNGKLVERREFRQLAESLTNARIALKKEWNMKNGVKTDKYFINGSILQKKASQEYEVVIL
jgi:hypothetical protein